MKKVFLTLAACAMIASGCTRVANTTTTPEATTLRTLPTTYDAYLATESIMAIIAPNIDCASWQIIYDGADQFDTENTEYNYLTIPIADTIAIDFLAHYAAFLQGEDLPLDDLYYINVDRSSGRTLTVCKY